VLAWRPHGGMLARGTLLRAPRVTGCRLAATRPAPDGGAAARLAMGAAVPGRPAEPPARGRTAQPPVLPAPASRAQLTAGRLTPVSMTTMQLITMQLITMQLTTAPLTMAPLTTAPLTTGRATSAMLARSPAIRPRRARPSVPGAPAAARPPAPS